MDRRTLVRVMGAVGLSTIAARLVGCGPVESSQASKLGEGPATTRVQVYDLVMEGWSVLGSGYLGETGVLHATQIRDFATITLDYIQDPHGHKFTLTDAQFAQLLLGQQVSVLTTMALDHHHEVRIKPAHHADGSVPIEVEIDANGHPVHA